MIDDHTTIPIIKIGIIIRRCNSQRIDIKRFLDYDMSLT